MKDEQVEGKGSTYSLAFRRIRVEQPSPDNRNGGSDAQAFGWIRHTVADWTRGNQPAVIPRRRLNSASISVLARRMMAREKARALGRKLPDFRACALVLEAKLLERTNASR